MKETMYITEYLGKCLHSLPEKILDKIPDHSCQKWERWFCGKDGNVTLKGGRVLGTWKQEVSTTWK